MLGSRPGASRSLYSVYCKSMIASVAGEAEIVSERLLVVSGSIHERRAECWSPRGSSALYSFANAGEWRFECAVSRKVS